MAAAVRRFAVERCVADETAYRLRLGAIADSTGLIQESLETNNAKTGNAMTIK